MPVEAVVGATSSSPLAGFACVGAGVPPRAFKNVLAVVKAYSTCVGAGPFVRELFGDEAETLRERGGDSGEYGATTGRPRRVGWFDAVATRYGCRVQGATQVALSMLDVLGYLDEIPVCVAYKLDGEKHQDFSAPVNLHRSKPIYRTLKGWKCDVSHIRSFDDLPWEAKRYIRFIEELVQVPIGWISVGPSRDAIFPSPANKGTSGILTKNSKGE